MAYEGLRYVFGSGKDIHRQRLGLVPVCGHTVIADFPASSDGGHTGTEVS